MNSKEPFKRILIEEKEIIERAGELGKLINERYKGETVYLVGVLKGSFMFLAELCKHIVLPVVIDFMVVSSYGNSRESSGKVRIIKDIYSDIEGKNVIIVEDIVDTGLTIDFIRKLFMARNAKSVRVCSLLFKPSSYKLDVPPEYVGFEIEGVFVGGYGLDIMQYYRNVPYIGEVNIDWRPEE